jgi:hemerythrin-like domain-containing protein
MQARGPLMIEHRLIEKMLKAIQRALEHAEQTQSIDPYFVDTAVDFIRVYADRTHHGKEEDILFRELRKKPLTDKDRQLMDELIADHMFSRSTTKALVEANARYRNGDKTALSELTASLKTLIEFYPIHIKKEDDVFFPASRNYFSEQEDQAMLAEFWEFDRQMIHEKYKAVVRDAGPKGI